MKRIANFMTPQPWTVQLDDSLAVAQRMIAEREIHHLPVIDAGVVVGMVTETELVRARERLGTVADVMTPVQEVDAHQALDEVLDLMIVKHRDAVAITNDGDVVGIFTATDAVRVLRDMLRRRRARA